MYYFKSFTVHPYTVWMFAFSGFCFCKQNEKAVMFTQTSDFCAWTSEGKFTYPYQQVPRTMYVESCLFIAHLVFAVTPF